MVGGARTELWRRLSFCYCLVHVNVCAVERERERERENKNPCSDTQFKFQLSILFYFISLFSFFFSPFPPLLPSGACCCQPFSLCGTFFTHPSPLWVKSVPSTTLFIYLFIYCWAFFASGSISLAFWWGPGVRILRMRSVGARPSVGLDLI